jgi:hypothetical protein
MVLDGLPLPRFRCPFRRRHSRLTMYVNRHWIGAPDRRPIGTLERRVLAVACAVGAGRGWGDGASAGWLVILIPAFESPAIVAGFDDVAISSNAVVILASPKTLWAMPARSDEVGGW